MVLKIKMKAKRQAAKKAQARKSDKTTIADLVRARLGKNISYPYSRLRAEVKKLNPRSKFDETHYAWYKSRIANGKLKGMK